MKRKKDSGGGGANWMDTYGDMVTLLLCFFVLLYSMSSISEDNWKAIVMSFNPDALTQITATPGGKGPSADGDGAGVDPVPEMTQEMVDADIAALYESLAEYIAEENLESSVAVTQDGGKVYVTFYQATFFNGDSSVLRKESYPILDAVSGMLDHAKESIYEVRVQGHTARARDVPNNPQTDRSLSSQRAANVVTYVQTHSDLQPAKLVSEGRGEWQPVGDNRTEEGRAKNRRVEMIISGRNLAEELGEENIMHYSTNPTPTQSE